MIRPGTKFRFAQLSAVGALTLSFALIASAAPQQNAASNKSTPAKKAVSTSSHKPGASAKRSRRKSTRIRGQQKIDSDRARSIQEALIREHYLSGEPTGTWNQSCEDAMRKYQADHGWQSKTVPDSRALISLGLGPSKDHLLNPESAMTTVPDPPKADSSAPTSRTPPVSETGSPQ